MDNSYLANSETQTSPYCALNFAQKSEGCYLKPSLFIHGSLCNFVELFLQITVDLNHCIQRSFRF